MSFTQPDLSEVLSNEQLFNANLISLRTELRNKLTLFDISYSDQDTILELIEKIAPNHYLDFTSDKAEYYLVGMPVRVQNAMSAGWNAYNSEGYYVNATRRSAETEMVALGLYSTYQKSDVNGTDNFKMRMILDFIDGYNNSYGGVGFVIGTPSQETAFNGVFFGAAQNSNGELYPAIMIFNNSTSPTITYVTDGGTIPSSKKFKVIVENDYDENYGSVSVEWDRMDGTLIWNDNVGYSDFNSSGMNGKISMASVTGANPAAQSSPPKVVTMFNSFIDK